MDDETQRITGDAPRLLAERYELKGLIGSGGMADVELAHDRELDRQVAVKLLRSRYATDPAFQRRFGRETQNASMLSHPNIVAVLDSGATEGRPYIVMEYVPGRSLEDLVAQERLLPERAAEIVGDVALALDYAHSRGLVHRDVKPGNILIDPQGQVKVTDFGIARAVDAQDATQTAAVFGTAAYCAPEQAQGFEVDRRTDVYALGVVLYELLTGRQPFSADTAVALAYQHVSAQPIPPSRLSNDVTPELEAVVLRAMAKDPNQRYASARDLNTDLQRAIAGLPVSAPLAASAAAAYSSTQALGAPATAPLPGASPPAEPEEDRPRRGRAAGIILLILLLLAAIGAAVILGAELFEGEVIETVEVPDLAGMPFDEAQAQLTEVGLQAEFGEAEEDPEVEPNHVIRTEPVAGTPLEAGSAVVLVLSDGPPLVEVPDVSGQDLGDARDVLVDAELEPGDVSEEPSEDIAEGAVITTQPPAGESVEVGSTVALVISEGDPPVEVPDVVDRTEQQARSLLEAEGLQVQVVEEFSDAVDEGRVIRQTPAAGDEVPQGSTVTIVVSRGPDEPDEPDEPEEPEEPPEDGNDGNSNEGNQGNSNEGDANSGDEGNGETGAGLGDGEGDGDGDGD